MIHGEPNFQPHRPRVIKALTDNGFLVEDSPPTARMLQRSNAYVDGSPIGTPNGRLPVAIPWLWDEKGWLLRPGPVFGPGPGNTRLALRR